MVVRQGYPPHSKTLENSAETGALKDAPINPFGPILTQRELMIVKGLVDQGSRLVAGFNGKAKGEAEEEERKEDARRAARALARSNPIEIEFNAADERARGITAIEGQEIVTSRLITGGDDSYKGEAIGTAIKFDGADTIIQGEAIRNRHEIIQTSTEEIPAPKATFESKMPSAMNNHFQSAAIGAAPASTPSIIDMVIASLPPPFTPPRSKT